MPRHPFKFIKLFGPPDFSGPYYVCVDRETGKPLGGTYDQRYFNIYDELHGKNWKADHPVPEVGLYNPEKAETRHARPKRFKTRREAGRYFHRKDVEWRWPEDSERFPGDEQHPYVEKFWERQGGRPENPDW